MTLDEAQRDVRLAHLSGAPGLSASAFAGLVAGFVAFGAAPSSAVITLFAAGMLIHPVGVLLCKTFQPHVAAFTASAIEAALQPPFS